MNKDLFKIDSDEVRRILSLHEESSKKQYLNIVSEQLSQDLSSYTLTANISLENTKINAMELKLFKGTKFSKIKNTNYLSTNDKTKYLRPNDATGQAATTFTGKIMYNCKTGKFFIKGQQSDLFYEDKGARVVGSFKFLTENLSTVCNSKEGQYKSGGEYTLNNGQFFIPKSTKFTKTKNGAHFISNYYGNMQIGVQTLQGTYTANTVFNCSDSKFYINKVGYTEDKGNTLTTKLKGLYCKSQEGPTNNNVSPKQNPNLLYTIGQEHDLGNNVIIKPKDNIIKSYKYPDFAAIMRGNTVIAYFNCKTNTWSDSLLSDKKGLLTGTIKQKVCPQILSSSSSTVSTSADTQTVGGSTVGGSTVGGTNTGNLTRRQSRFIAKTQTKINNIQKLLGVTPTGQLDSTQIDTLINKLKG